jgi:hypothetical protein
MPSLYDSLFFFLLAESARHALFLRCDERALLVHVNSLLAFFSQGFSISDERTWLSLQENTFFLFLLFVSS